MNAFTYFRREFDIRDSCRCQSLCHLTGTSHEKVPEHFLQQVHRQEHYRKLGTHHNFDCNMRVFQFGGLRGLGSGLLRWRAFLVWLWCAPRGVNCHCRRCALAVSPYASAEHRFTCCISLCSPEIPHATRAIQPTGYPLFVSRCPTYSKPKHSKKWRHSFLSCFSQFFCLFVCFWKSLWRHWASGQRRLCAPLVPLVSKQTKPVLSFLLAERPQAPCHSTLGISFTFCDDLMSKTATTYAFFLACFL